MIINRPTGIPELTAHITYTNKKKYPKTISGCAMDNLTGARGRLIRKKAVNQQDVKCVEDDIVNIIRNEAQIQRTESIRTATIKGERIDNNNPLSIAFLEVKKNPGFLSEWNEHTFNRSMTLFENQVLPVLLENVSLDGTEIVFDSEKLLDHLIKTIQASGKNKGVLSINETTAHHTLAAAQKIYNCMCHFDPSLPELDFGSSRRKRLTANEQVKSLPPEINDTFVKALEADAFQRPELVTAAVLMYDAGLRTAEAAAVIPLKDIIFGDDLTTVKVLFQERDGRRSETLKTDNAYRLVPLSFWGTTVIKNCVARIKEPANEYDAPVKSSDLSAYIRKKLTDAGLNNELWQRFREEEADSPERERNGRPIFDTTAYVLRRNRASLWQHVCGLTKTECDYLLGHANYSPKTHKPDFRLDSVQKEIARKIERYVANPNISRHPGLHPIEMKHGMDLDIIPYEKMQFVNTGETTLHVSLDVTAAVPGERIYIKSTKEVGWDGKFSSTPAKLDRPRTIIGHTKGVDDNEI